MGGASTPKRILVVEDDPEFAEFLAEICRLEGCDVDMAGSGTEALGLLERHAYDAALLDARMPPPDGPDLYHALEQRQPALSRRLAFITGDVLDVDMRRRLDETGAVVKEKPVRASEVRQLLQQLLKT